MWRFPKARLFALTCALLLLLAQHAGLGHAVWHAVRDLPVERYQALGDAAPASDAASLCSFDAAIGQVLGGLPSGSAMQPPRFPGLDVVQAAFPAFVTARFLAPHPRGPPRLS